MDTAARGMLHSSRMWNSTYDLARERREVEQHADGMGQYRQHRLERARAARAGAGGAAAMREEGEAGELEAGAAEAAEH